MITNKVAMRVLIKSWKIQSWEMLIYTTRWAFILAFWYGMSNLSIPDENICPDLTNIFSDKEDKEGVPGLCNK